MIGFAVLACAPTVAHLAPSPASTDAELKEIVVTAKRRAQAAADVELKRQVEVALASDPYFYSEHVTVTIAHGVATRAYLRRLGYAERDSHQQANPRGKKGD